MMREATHVKEKNLVEWRAPEFKKRVKSLDWFLGVGLAAALLVFWAAYTLNIMFLLVVIVGTTALFLWANRKPRIYHFQITPTGIWIGKQFLPFQSLESFWIFEFPDEHLLFLRHKSRFSAGTHILISEKEVSSVKSALRDYLPEIEENYSFIDWLGDWIRF